MNLLVYYNPNFESFYLVYSDYIIRDVGYVNGYGHILIQMLANRNGEYINIKSSSDLRKIPWKKEKLKIRLIDGIIHQLNKLKNEDRERK